MAKDKKKENLNNDEESFGSKLGAALMVILIVIVWLLIFAMLVKLDVAGMGTRLRPLIKDVQGLNYILPPVPDEILIEENHYPYADISEAIDLIKELEEEKAALEKKNADYAQIIVDLQGEVARLKPFEEEQEEFLKRVQQFDVEVVYNSQAPDISEYKKFYEGMYPDNAEKIYRQVVEQLEYDEAIKEKANLIKNLKPGVAAATLEEMTADIVYTCKILLCLKPAEATEILNKMDTLFVARIFQTMHDMDEEWYEKIQNNMLQNQ